MSEKSERSTNPFPARMAALHVSSWLRISCSCSSSQVVSLSKFVPRPQHKIRTADPCCCLCIAPLKYLPSPPPPGCLSSFCVRCESPAVTHTSAPQQSLAASPDCILHLPWKLLLRN